MQTAQNVNALGRAPQRRRRRAHATRRT